MRFLGVRADFHHGGTPRSSEDSRGGCSAGYRVVLQGCVENVAVDEAVEIVLSQDGVLLLRAILDGL